MPLRVLLSALRFAPVLFRDAPNPIARRPNSSDSSHWRRDISQAIHEASLWARLRRQPSRCPTFLCATWQYTDDFPNEVRREILLSRYSCPPIRDCWDDATQNIFLRFFLQTRHSLYCGEEKSIPFCQNFSSPWWLSIPQPPRKPKPP